MFLVSLLLAFFGGLSSGGGVPPPGGGGAGGGDTVGSMPLPFEQYVQHHSTFVRFAVLDSSGAVLGYDENVMLTMTNHKLAAVPQHFTAQVNAWLGQQHPTPQANPSVAHVGDESMVLKTGWWWAGQWVRYDCVRKEGESNKKHAIRFAQDVWDLKEVMVPDHPQPPPPPNGLAWLIITIEPRGFLGGKPMCYPPRVALSDDGSIPLPHNLPARLRMAPLAA